ncbi:hypothetical protein [Actinokineospora iranica]|uniref:Uncharacterized protein n=1 Tax=Actinokineospora iranica TaxID=1271860 RepID=A0A1G6VVB5_9PSEU|nr:hypothetical protein [Actinokineospora iranica]SDD57620.1 hypothetical protein SAMN05216174_113121 [Actinokineospora iranica]
MRKLRFGVSAVALAALGLLAVPGPSAQAAAAAPANVTCATGSAVLDFNPGMGVTTAPIAASGRGTASGCSGIVGRTAFSGVDAVLTYQATGVASCSWGQGTGHFILQLNTSPPQVVRGDFAISTRELTATFTGEANSVAIAQATNPLEDCVTVQVTRVRAVFEPIYIVTS